MKKTLAILITISMLATLLIGCSSKKKGKDTDILVSSLEIVSSEPENISADENTEASSETKETIVSSQEKTGNTDKVTEDKKPEAVSPEQYIFYNKGYDTMFYNLSTKKSWQARNDESSLHAGSNGLPRITADGKSLFYYMDFDLFYRKTESNEPAVKIASNVSWYMFEEYGSSVIYITHDKVLYKSNLKKSIVIDRDIASYVAVSDDGKRLLYLKPSGEKEDLYYYDGNKSEKLASGVLRPGATEDISAIYYLKDSSLYKKELNKPEVKVADNITRDYWLSAQGVHYCSSQNGTEALFYYDGNTSTRLIQDTVIYLARSLGNEAIVFSVANRTNPENTDYYFSEGKKTIPFGVNSSEIEVKQTTICFDENKNVYFLGVSKKDGQKNLYKLSASSGHTEIYDTGVSENAQIMVFNNTIVYFKNENQDSQTATLFMNKKKIADNVYLYQASYSQEDKAIIYYTDWKDIQTGGTLWFCKDGQTPVKVAEKVNIFINTPTGHLVYIKDRVNYSGSLYINQFTQSSQKIDDNVSGVQNGWYGYAPF